jgi:lipoprotein-anchoring transpeptidase ErfK/SrfK
MVLGVVVALAVIAFLLLVVVFPPGISVSPGDGATEVNPDKTSLEISKSHWGAAITDVELTSVALAPDGSRGNEKAIDGQLRDGRFVLGDGSNPLQTDTEYTVTVRGNVKRLSFSGISDEQVTDTYTFTTITTPMPVLGADGAHVRYGEDASIDWNVPITDFKYELDGVESASRIDPDNPNRTYISLSSFEQGKEYALTITSATSASGVSMNAPLTTKLVTAPPLTVQFDPADGTDNASTQAHPAIVFSEPVSNPELAPSVVSIEPAVAGEFRWTEPTRLEYVTTEDWDYEQSVTISIAGGPSKLRGVGGGYIADDASATFTTSAYKTIDVDVTNQVLTLLENGVPVESFDCSSGASPHETPLGDFTIYAKVNKTDMRGPGYFAPDVPWVMVFKGDYTIHGNYWATSFGRPSSHGCVGLPVSIAKRVYDWTPIGTPLHIHE